MINSNRWVKYFRRVHRKGYKSMNVTIASPEALTRGREKEEEYIRRRTWSEPPKKGQQ